MPNISVKDVPQTWAQALRERAARNHRSLQGELMTLIEAAVAPESSRPGNSTSKVSASMAETQVTGAPTIQGQRDNVVGFDRFGQPIVHQGWKTVEQVVAELKAKYPDGPVLDQPLGVDIIRKDRDAR